MCGVWTHVCIHNAHALSVFTKLGTFYLHCTLVWFCRKTKYLVPSPGPILVERKVICYQLELGKEFADVSSGAFSQNVGKLFSELNLVTINLSLCYAAAD